MTGIHQNFFEPLHKAHAIEQVIFVVRFDREISEENLGAIRIGLGRIPKLPNRLPIRNLTIPIGAAGPADVSSVAGFTYNKLSDDDELEEELRLDKTSIIFKTFLYKRWVENWGVVRDYLDKLLPFYIKEASVQEVSLVVIDKFLWTSDSNSAKPALLLRPNSSHLVPYVYTTPDLWHSHTGAFLHVDHYTRRLKMLEVEYVDLSQKDGTKKRAITIKNAGVDTLGVPGYKALEFDGNSALDFISNHMDQLHTLNKEILREILNDEMCERIALGI